MEHGEEILTLYVGSILPHPPSFFLFSLVGVSGDLESVPRPEAAVQAVAHLGDGGAAGEVGAVAVGVKGDEVVALVQGREADLGDHVGQLDAGAQRGVADVEVEVGGRVRGAVVAAAAQGLPAGDLGYEVARGALAGLGLDGGGRGGGGKGKEGGQAGLHFD